MAAGDGRRHRMAAVETTIYTAKLWRRGVDLGRDASGLPVFTAADIAGAAPQPLHVDAEIATAAAALSKSGIAVIPCVDAAGRYAGCLSVQRLAEALNHADILAALQGRAGTGVLVVSEDGDAVIGWITHENVLARMRFGPGMGCRGSG